MTPELLSAREWKVRASRVPAAGHASAGFWAVLRALADHADFATGRSARPSYVTLALAAKASRSVVARSLRVARGVGLVVVEQERHRAPTVYRLAWPALTPEQVSASVRQGLQSARADGGHSERPAAAQVATSAPATRPGTQGGHAEPGTQLSARAGTPPLLVPEEEEQQQGGHAATEVAELRALVVAQGERLERLERELVALRLRASEAPEARPMPANGRQEEGSMDRETEAPKAPRPGPRALQPEDGAGALLAELGGFVTDANRAVALEAARIAARPAGASPDRRLAAVAVAIAKPAGYWTGDRGRLGRVVGALLRPADRGGMPEDEVAERVATVRAGAPRVVAPVALSSEDLATLEARSQLADRLALSGRLEDARALRRENDQARAARCLSERLAALGTDERAILQDLEARRRLPRAALAPSVGPSSGLVASVLGSLTGEGGQPGRPVLRVLREAV